MTTDRQLAANRQNAQKSTGPRTAQDKAIASRNNTRHGLRSLIPSGLASCQAHAYFQTARFIEAPHDRSLDHHPVPNTCDSGRSNPNFDAHPFESTARSRRHQSQTGPPMNAPVPRRYTPGPA